jgi:hypothetical protein
LAALEKLENTGKGLGAELTQFGIAWIAAFESALFKNFG